MGNLIVGCCLQPTYAPMRTVAWSSPNPTEVCQFNASISTGIGAAAGTGSGFLPNQENEEDMDILYLCKMMEYGWILLPRWRVEDTLKGSTIRIRMEGLAWRIMPKFTI